MRREREQASWLIVLAASVGLHVAVFGALWALRPAEPPPAPPKTATSVELKWLSADDVVSAPATRAPPSARTDSSPPTASRGAAAGSSAVEPSANGLAFALGTADGGVSGSGGEGEGDRPLSSAGVLRPGLGSVLRMPTPYDAEPQRGTTLRNHPSERVDEAAMAEYTGEVLSRRLGEQLRADVGAAAAGVGSAPPHFRRLESGLRHTFETSQVDHGDVGGAGAVAKAVVTPGASAEAAQRVTDSALGRAVQNQVGMGPGMDAQRSGEAMLQMMGAMEGLKERLAEPMLRTVLQLTCDPTGAIADVTVLEQSGDPRFDESVMHLTRKTARLLPDDDDARGLGAAWWQTRWQYTLERPGVRVKLLDAVRLSPPATP